MQHNVSERRKWRDETVKQEEEEEVEEEWKDLAECIPVREIKCLKIGTCMYVKHKLCPSSIFPLAELFIHQTVTPAERKWDWNGIKGRDDRTSIILSSNSSSELSPQVDEREENHI